MPTIRVFVFVLFLGVFANDAHAMKFNFGPRDVVHFVAKTKIIGPNGTPLILGHLVTMQYFLLPYSVSSGGYVLMEAVHAKRFVTVPQGPMFEGLKARGQIPKKLPVASLGLWDYFIGYSLWLALAGIAAIPFAKRWILSKVSTWRSRGSASIPG